MDKKTASGVPAVPSPHGTPAIATVDRLHDDMVVGFRLRYETAWKAFIDSPIWDVKVSDRTKQQTAVIEELADRAHVAFWEWKNS